MSTNCNRTSAAGQAHGGVVTLASRRTQLSNGDRSGQHYSKYAASMSQHCCCCCCRLLSLVVVVVFVVVAAHAI